MRMISGRAGSAQLTRCVFMSPSQNCSSVYYDLHTIAPVHLIYQLRTHTGTDDHVPSSKSLKLRLLFLVILLQLLTLLLLMLLLLLPQQQLLLLLSLLMITAITTNIRRGPSPHGAENGCRKKMMKRNLKGQGVPYSE